MNMIQTPIAMCNIRYLLEEWQKVALQEMNLAYKYLLQADEVLALKAADRLFL